MVSPGNSLEVQILGPAADLPNQKLRGQGQQSAVEQAIQGILIHAPVGELRLAYLISGKMPEILGHML